MNEVVLQNSDLKLVIDAKKGGCVTSFKYRNVMGLHNVFRDASGIDDVNDSAFFPLAPFASRVQLVRFQWNGETANLTPNFGNEPHALHGQAWQLPWHVKSSSTHSATLVFDFKNGDWPWDYSLELVYSLIGSELHITLTLQNNALTQMPSGLGLHPFFDIDEDTIVKVDASTMWEVDDTLLPTIIKKSPQHVNSSSGILASRLLIDNVLINDTNERVITWPNRGFKANIASTGCPFTVMYRPDNATFLCVEPISHSTNALNLEKKAAIAAGVIPLAPGEQHQVTMTLKMCNL